MCVDGDRFVCDNIVDALIYAIGALLSPNHENITIYEPSTKEIKRQEVAGDSDRKFQNKWQTITLVISVVAIIMSVITFLFDI